MTVIEDAHEFDAPIEYHDFGRMGYTVVYLPDALVATLDMPANPRLRVHADVDGVPIDGAFQPGHGRYYLIVSKRHLKAMGAALGDTVIVRFTLADPDSVDIPDALRHALRARPTARKAWDALSAGKRRALAYRVASAKTDPTVRKRIDEVLATLS